MGIWPGHRGYTPTLYEKCHGIVNDHRESLRNSKAEEIILKEQIVELSKEIPMSESERQTFRFKVQGFFICHIIVIQGIIRSEM